MKRVFADTLYWVAIARPGDRWSEPAKRATAAIDPVQIVTTDEVLSKFLTAMSRGGPAIRAAAVQIVRNLLQNPNVIVVPQSRQPFLAALDRYGQSADKEYSLTDCSSMNVMDRFSITDVLTNDRHFEQEGYTILIRK